MRNFIDIARRLTESLDTVTADETKFWFSARTGRFIDHDIDSHHTRILATSPADFDLRPEDVAHHPHANGEYSTEYDEFDRDDEDGEENADNDDMGMFASAFAKGWVRGGHEIDVYAYHEMDEISHDGGIYLQGDAVRDLQKCVRACMKRWPDIAKFTIESGQRHFQISDWQSIDAFIKRGTIS